MEPKQLTNALKDEARRHGFQLAGACPAVTPAGIHEFRSWLAAGYAGEMDYLARRAEAYHHPSHLLDGVRSLLLLAMNYATVEPQSVSAGEGRISRYAWGSGDYHDIIHARLKKLSGWLRNEVPGAAVRGVVDTAPLLEREFAQLAGLGWIGKNTLLLNKRAGSWFFLAALLTDVELAYDQPHDADHCGTCTACLDACPTDAFPRPYVLDATRCISYLTIELRDAVPESLRAGVGDWLFGCDICQDVCPWNHRSPTTEQAEFHPTTDSNPVPLAELFSLNDEAFRQRFRKTPLWRAKRRGVLRNAAIVLGNQRNIASVNALIQGLQDDEPLVRATSAWALGQIGGETARHALGNRQHAEAEEEVRHEIAKALGK